MTLDYIDPIWAMQIKDTAVTTSITGKDIVARLRATVDMDGSRGIEHDAADEIERLRGLLDELWNHPGDTYVRAVIRRVIGDRITAVQPQGSRNE